MNDPLAELSAINQLSLGLGAAHNDTPNWRITKKEKKNAHISGRQTWLTKSENKYFFLNINKIPRYGCLLEWQASNIAETAS